MFVILVQESAPVEMRERSAKADANECGGADRTENSARDEQLNQPLGQFGK